MLDGKRVAREVLFVRPPQRQTELVEAMDLALDPHGHVQVDARLETSRKGIFAAGDLTTPMLNHDLAFGTPVTAQQG